MLIDTHCHLSYPGLFENAGEVLARADAAGVKRFVTIGTHVADHQKALKLAREHAAVFAALGIHPHHAGETEEGYEAFLANAVRHHEKVVALGECGLDYHYDFCPRLLQRGVFINQLEIARRLSVPVILHVREAHADGVAIVKDYAADGSKAWAAGDAGGAENSEGKIGSGLRFVVHCFTGTPAECEAWLALGAYVGITGIVTYKNADEVRAAAKLVPTDRLLVETDAPYLSPEPVRKVKTNEPAHVVHTAKFLAELRGVAFEELAKQTTENAVRFYGERIAIPPPGPNGIIG